MNRKHEFFTGDHWLLYSGAVIFAVGGIVGLSEIEAESAVWPHFAFLGVSIACLIMGEYARRNPIITLEDEILKFRTEIGLQYIPLNAIREIHPRLFWILIQMQDGDKVRLFTFRLRSLGERKRLIAVIARGISAQQVAAGNGR